MASTLDGHALDRLDRSIDGRVVRPGDSDYDDARAIWNGMIDRRPGGIARCTTTADVRAVVAFSGDADWPLAVRGGGHNVAGHAVCDDGLVLDLSQMAGVTVDADARTARVDGGAIWADVDAATQAHGLATPGGVVSDTGVAGLTLGGGIGHLRGRYGLSCDNLRAVELVTADGEARTASPDENPELFWGCKGGGGNFGVATAFEFALHPVGPEVATCLAFYDAADLESVLAGYREAVAEAPDAVSTLTFAGTLPDPELFDASVVDREKIAVMGCHAGDPALGEAALRPFRELAAPLVDLSDVREYSAFQQLLDEDYPDGMRYYWSSLYLVGLPDAAIARIREWAARAPSPLSTVDVWQLGGAIADVDLAESPFPGRDAPFLLGVEANWEDPAADEANVAWARDCLAAMREFSDGSVYLNFPGEADDNSMVQRTYGSAFDRLVALKDRYDPTNRFDRNQNVAPSGT